MCLYLSKLFGCNQQKCDLTSRLNIYPTVVILSGNIHHEILKQFIAILSKGIMSSCFNLALILTTLCVTQLQSAPLDVSVVGIDRIVLPKGLPGFRYALVDSEELQQLQTKLDEAEVKVVLMELLQFNMMRIMLVLDIVILICLYFYAKGTHEENCYCEVKANTFVKI
ncbi:uncharacterized protein LOC117574709 isoform X1 [Drosophila albomicans]|uniref:Uncharacterized protein LOC117574709 isoform X1 n=1 Tax=Drosophila albomicans TaxID=7291 RepID=A0A6P8XNB4_DROAB|nr:uncharacterized protein LOC117574709 isoform X1 [Drosophila albomicans]